MMTSLQQHIKTPFMLGLIGFPLGHSYSADYFNNLFTEKQIDGTYKLFPIDNVQEIQSILDNNPTLKGFNVTIPYKEKIIESLDDLSEEVKSIGAVNVVGIRDKRDSDKELIGFNTDWIGFQRSYLNIKDFSTNEALILGTGGAAKAVSFALERLGISCKFVTRNPNLSKLHPYKDKIISYSMLDKDIVFNHKLIVNTTPVGMFPNGDEYPEIPYEGVTKNHLCYDLIYNPAETEFMKRCAERGARVKNGLEMLYLQAQAAWEIWYNNFL